MSAYITAEQFEAAGAFIGQRLKERADQVVALIGDGVATSFNVVHNLGTRDVIVEVMQNGGDYQTVIPVVKRPTTDRVTITFEAVHPINAHRVLITRIGQ